MVKDHIDDINVMHVYGAGIRILKENAEVYGYTNEVDEQGLMKLAKKLNKAYQAEQIIKDFEFKKFNKEKTTIINKCSKDIDNSLKIGYLKTCCKAIMNYSDKIVQAISTITDETQLVTIANSNGVFKNDVRNHQRVFAIAIASDENGMQQASDSYGGNFDISNFDSFDFESFALNIAKEQYLP